jgi:nicotinamidase/pyrazinamidase
MGHANEAMIIIDVQNDFCPGGKLAVPGGDEIVGPINALMEQFDNVVLSQDWHPAGHSSFASSHEGAAEFSEMQMPYGPQLLWPDHCIQGTKGAEFHASLNLSPAQMIVRKGYNRAVDSYSAFFENDHKTSTGLAGFLRERGIEKLTFVGLALDFCVNFSAVDAAKQGFRATVETSLCRSIAVETLNAAMAGMKSAGVTLNG